MKIHITSRGDASVGIAAQEATVEWGGPDWPVDIDDRLGIRATLHEAFAMLFGETLRGVRVRFDDECSGCGWQVCRCPPEE